MKICKKHDFGKVRGFELGLGYIGSPIMTVHFYIMDDILIDTGPSNMRKDFLHILQHEEINHAALTHHHEDHSGNAACIINRKNVPLYGHPITVEKMRKGFNILPYQHYMFGSAEPAELLPFPEKIEGNKFTLWPVHTPGHSRDHTVLLEKNEGWLFSGDLFLGPVIKIFRADEDFYSIMKSLKRVLELDFDRLFCSVNPRETGGKEMIRMKLGFMEDLLGLIRKLQKKGMSEKEILNHVKGKESRITKYFTQGNVSYSNMIKSILKDGFF